MFVLNFPRAPAYRPASGIYVAKLCVVYPSYGGTKGFEGEYLTQNLNLIGV